VTPGGSELLTVREVAAVLRVSRRAAYNAMHAMRHYRIGKHLRVTRQALTAWLEANAEEGAQTMPVRGAPWAAGVLPFRPRATPASSEPPIHITQPRKRASAAGKE
jgi:excisionase family DNA binding protein